MKNHAMHLSVLMILMLILCVPTATKAQTLLSRYRPGATTEGAVYFLPRTALRVSVLVEKTDYKPGDFSPYAQRYLRVNSVEQEPSTSFRIIEVRVDALPQPDTTKVYAVKFDARTVASRITLADDGRLLALNVPDATDVVQPAPFEPAPRLPMANPRQFLTEEILSCGSTAKMAELTAHEVYDLRENRTLLIKGQADFMPQDGQQMQLMLQELKCQDDALSSMFVGVTRRDTTEHVLWLRPDAPQGRQVLFRLSQLRGLVDADDLSGEPFYAVIDDITELPATDEVAARKQKKSETGIFVNVPGTMRITLYQGIEPLLTKDFPAPQFGETLLLSGSLFNKRYTTRLLLNALTGAVEKLEADDPR